MQKFFEKSSQVDLSYQVKVLQEGVNSLMAKTTSDLIRGIRAHKRDESTYIKSQVQVIKKELKSTTRSTKATAIQKLSYLQMLGYEAEYAAVEIIEVMSYPSFAHKRVGYLAASLCFSQDTQMVIMATNLIRRDITAANQYEAGLALSALAQIATPDLARDLAPDLVNLLATSRPYVRKRAVLALYQIFVAFPDSLRPAFPKLKERLKDEEPAVVCAAVSVLTELASNNAANYIKLAPPLFRILSSNPPNAWLQLKLIKLFGMLCPVEPRLPKRLIEPMTALINTTTNTALLFECINTCTIGLVKHLPIIRLCVQKLRFFIEDQDQNMKYLGLQALNNIMKVHPKVVREHRPTVIACLDDPDESIRLRALDLLSGMVDKRNLADVVEKLLDHVASSEGRYKQTVVEKIIDICSQKNYAHITDFEWYIDVLVRLSAVPGNECGQLLSDQIMDVAVRVDVVRKYAVFEMAALLQDPRFYDVGSGIVEVLSAAAWVCGEYGDKREAIRVVRALLDPRAAQLPGAVQSIFLQNALKIFSRVAALAAAEDADPLAAKAFSKVVNCFEKNLDHFKESQVIEVQERACFSQHLIEVYAQLGPGVTSEVALLFAEPLEPVHPDAAGLVPIPEGLDLDTQIIEWPEESEEEEEEEFSPNWGYDDATSSPNQTSSAANFATGYHAPISEVDTRYILRGGVSQPIPEVETLPNLGQQLKVSQPSRRGSSSGRRHKQGRKHRKAQVKTTMALPQGANASVKKAEVKRTPSKGGLGAVDLGSELTPEEKDLLERKVYAQAPTVDERLLNTSQMATTPVSGNQAARSSKGGRRRKKKKRSKKKDSDVELSVVDHKEPETAANPIPAQQLFESDDLSAPYRMVCSKKQDGVISIQVALMNKGDAVEDVQVVLEEGTLKSQKPENGFNVAEITPLRLVIEVTTLQVRGSIGGNAFTLDVSPASWISPADVDLDFVAGVIGEKGDELQLLQVEVEAADIKEGLKKIASELNLHTVQIQQGTAMFYGRAISGEDLIVVVKQGGEDGGKLEVQLKTVNAERGALLLKYLETVVFH